MLLGHQIELIALVTMFESTYFYPFKRLFYVFTNVAQPLTQIPSALNQTIERRVALERIAKFMKIEELEVIMFQIILLYKLV